MARCDTWRCVAEAERSKLERPGGEEGSSERLTGAPAAGERAAQWLEVTPSPHRSTRHETPSSTKSDSNDIPRLTPQKYNASIARLAEIRSAHTHARAARHALKRPTSAPSSSIDGANRVDTSSMSKSESRMTGFGFRSDIDEGESSSTTRISISSSSDAVTESSGHIPLCDPSEARRDLGCATGSTTSRPVGFEACGVSTTCTVSRAASRKRRDALVGPRRAFAAVLGCIVETERGRPMTPTNGSSERNGSTRFDDGASMFVFAGMRRGSESRIVVGTASSSSGSGRARRRPSSLESAGVGCDLRRVS